jgi:hypothetical protein
LAETNKKRCIRTRKSSVERDMPGMGVEHPQFSLVKFAAD